MNKLYSILCISVALSGYVFPQDGIIGGLGLGGGDDKPSRGDNPPLKPATGNPPGKPSASTKAADPSKPKAADKDTLSALEIILEARRIHLEKAIKDAEAGKKPRKFSRVSEAERSIKWMEKKLKEMEKQLDLADKEGAAELRNSIDAFSKEWAAVAAAIDEKRVPEGMTGEQWAKKQDEYYKAKAALESRRAHLARQLKLKREGELEDLKAMIDKAKATLQRIKDAGKDGDPAVRRLRKALLEKQAHEADLAMMKRQLEEYKQLQAEVRGEKSTRTDNLMQDVYRTSPLWYVERLMWVQREMSIQFATKPLTKKQQGLDVTPPSGAAPGSGAGSGAEDDDGDGIALPEWMKQKPKPKPKPGEDLNPEEKKKNGVDLKLWKKARRKALSAQLEDAHRQMLALGQNVKAEDAAELRHLRRSLESGDQIHGDHIFEKYRAQREAKIEKRRKELESTQQTRMAKRKKKMQTYIDQVKKKIATVGS